jgi:Uma2 family endonuclease
MSRAAPVQHINSFETFLELESTSLERHEFVDGNLFVMAGGTDRHNWVTMMLVALLMSPALQVGKRSYATDVLIRTPDDVGYYPDFFILGDTSLDTSKVKRRPTVIIEVLSPSTEAIDRGEKLRNYRSIPSLEQYILLSQDEALGEIYARQPDGSWRHDILQNTATLEIPSIGFSVLLTVLYENLPEV